jgi:hypothetical protein
MTDLARDQLRWPRVKARIWDVVQRRPGISAEELVDAVYGADPNGGPDSGRKAIHVHVNHMNRRLMREGMSIKGHVTYGYKILRYRSADTTGAA